MTSQTDELKPCAWCGTSSPEYDNCDYGSGQWYSCRGCPVVIKVGYNEDLNAAWNTRAASPEIDRLKRQVEVLWDALNWIEVTATAKEHMIDSYAGFRRIEACSRIALAAADKIEKE